MPEGANVFTPPEPFVNRSPAAPVRVENAPPGTVQSHPDISPAQLLWNEQQRRGDDAAGRLDPAKFVQVKDPLTGAITTRPRTAADGAVNPDQPAKPGDPAQPQPATATGDRLKIGDLELTTDQIKGLMERHALEESRKATLPASPDLYELALPGDFQMPEGIDFKWDVNDPVRGPLIQRAREFAAANNISQDGFSRMMGLYAASQIYEAQMINRAAAAEVEKLGAMGSLRVDAVKTFLHGHLGSELANALTKNLYTERQIVGLEKLMSKFSSQGVSGNPGAGRDDGGPAKISDADYANLSYAAKKEYAEHHAALAGHRY
jgi:hypothetical protein